MAHLAPVTIQAPLAPSLNKAGGILKRPSPTSAHRSALGQFMTPPGVARFIASLFPAATVQGCRLLDAGAGMGSLSSAFLDRWEAGDLRLASVAVDAYEFDPALLDDLRQRLDTYAARLPVRVRVLPGDFIEQAVSSLGLWGGPRYTHAILNPPYKKIQSNSHHRLLLRQAGIETSNLYSAFVALALALMEDGGQLVAIIPRSFCNGPYFRPFREFLLERAAIRHLHLFEARDKAFSEDGVLQENLILRLERGGKPGPVAVSTSTDASLTDYAVYTYPLETIVSPGDPERVIHIPTSPDMPPHEALPGLVHSLAELGIEVSTGPVVDFRLRDWLRQQPGPDTVPLLYPCHFRLGRLDWPLAESRKPNAIVNVDETAKWLYPNGSYCVTRRLSSKEEKRRIVAGVVEPAALPDVPLLGFENHLNVFHQGKKGLPVSLARGLAAFLNSRIADTQLRRFSGHTQVNASDLRRLKYPSRETLTQLGAWAMAAGDQALTEVDDKLEKMLS
jgi:adenine-specific DNA-methyltransferase